MRCAWPEGGPATKQQEHSQEREGPGRSGRLAGLLRSWWQHRVSFAISLGVTAGALTIYILTFVGERPTPVFDFIQRIELGSLDTRFRYRPARYSRPDPRIVVVDIDQHTQEVLGRWPFSRGHFADMLDVLREDGARVAAFDITFSKPDETLEPIRALQERMKARQLAGRPVDPALATELEQLEKEYDADAKLAQAIGRFGRVVLGNFFLYTQADLRGLDDATLDNYANLLAFFPFPQVRPLNPDRDRRQFHNLIENYAPYGLLPRGTQANIEVLTQALRGEQASTGFFNVQPDPDGVVRRALLAVPYGRSDNFAEWDLYASLDVQTVRVFLGLPDDQTMLHYGPTGIVDVQFGDVTRVRTDDIGRAMINFEGPVRTYHYESLAGVVQKKFKPGTFRDKIVLIGASATGIGDLRSTPYGGLDYPGVEIHANVIDNILNQGFLQRGAKQVVWDLALILLFGVPLGIWLALAAPRWLWLGLLLLVPYLGGVFYAFLHGWWLNFTIPSLTLVGNVGLVALYRALIEEREKRKVRGAFQQYLSPEVIRRLLQNPELVRPRKTEVSVMFSDIRGFTTISEQLDAQELAHLLNEYLTEMTRIVFEREGTLDKYIGDAVMAFWGAPFEEPGHAAKACRTALEMMERLGVLQQRWKASNGPDVDIGIGLNTGTASVGNMGSELRYGYTALGDAVNLASRLEALNKEYGTHILATEFTVSEAKHAGVVFRELDLIRVKGKIQPVKIYEVLGPANGTSDVAERAALFAEGRSHYQQRQWRAAEAVFRELRKRWPDDGPAAVFQQRCREYLQNDPGTEWDGVYTMTHK